jgi:hypothetical protein
MNVYLSIVVYGYEKYINHQITTHFAGNPQGPSLSSLLSFLAGVCAGGGLGLVVDSFVAAGADCASTFFAGVPSSHLLTRS